AIGGAGTFDGAFRTAIIAGLIAWASPRARRRRRKRQTVTEEGQGNVHHPEGGLVGRRRSTVRQHVLRGAGAGGAELSRERLRVRLARGRRGPTLTLEWDWRST